MVCQFVISTKYHIRQYHNASGVNFDSADQYLPSRYQRRFSCSVGKPGLLARAFVPEIRWHQLSP